MEDLMTCPFCGSDDITVGQSIGGKGAWCGQCGCHAGVYRTERVAMAAWNTRDNKPLAAATARAEAAEARVAELGHAIDVAHKAMIRQGNALNWDGIVSEIVVAINVIREAKGLLPQGWTPRAALAPEPDAGSDDNRA